MLPPRRLIESGGGCFGSHRLGRRFQGEQYSDLRPLSIDHAPEVADVWRVQPPRLDRKDDLLRFTPEFIMEVQPSIYSLVSTPLVRFCCSRADQSECPCLELERV